MALTKKSAPPPTLEERSNSATATAEAALSTFRSVADDLEAAAFEHEEVSVIADAEALRLRSISESASEQAAERRTQARRIRELVG